MGERSEPTAGDQPPAVSARRPDATSAAGSRLWAIPAAAVGILALLLISYGQFVQPRLLPEKYARHLTSASREYAAAISPENPSRTVDESLGLLRRTRLAHQRLATLRPADRSLALAHGQFASSAAEDLEAWLHRDRGYLRGEERQRMQAAALELSAEADRLMHGLLNQRDEYGDAAAAAIAERIVRDGVAAGQQKALSDLLAYASTETGNASLAALVSAAAVAASGSVPASAAGPDFALYLRSLDSPRREVAFAARVMALLRTDPRRAYAEAVDRAGDATSFTSWNDRVARLQILCVAGRWDDVEAATIETLADADTAESLESVRRRVADACMAALRSGLPTVEPAWAADCDRAQNLVLRLDGGRPDAASLIEPICKARRGEVSEAVVRTLSQSQLSPLREVLKSLYLAFHDAPEAAAEAVAPGGDEAVASLCQLSLRIAAQSPSEAETLENLMQSLTEKRSDSGTAWYTLAFLQSGREDRAAAAISLGRAEEILGPVPAVETLKRRLEGFREAGR